MWTWETESWIESKIEWAGENETVCLFNWVLKGWYKKIFKKLNDCCLTFNWKNMKKLHKRLTSFECDKYSYQETRHYWH